MALQAGIYEFWLGEVYHRVGGKGSLNRRLVLRAATG
jgi:hypothetical protein